MRKLLLTIAATALIGTSFVATPACAGTGDVVGTIFGAGLGALLGNQFGHGPGRVGLTALGAFGGAFVGHGIGASLDEENRYSGTRAAYYTPYSSDMFGGNPANVYTPNYVAPPAPPPQALATTMIDLSDCREFVQSVSINGRMQAVHGSACRQPDGSWQIVR